MPALDLSQFKPTATPTGTGSLDLSKFQATQPDNSHISIFHQAVQDLAQPFLKPIATVSAGFVPTLFDLVGQNDFAKKLRTTAINKGIDYGYLGITKPFGADEFNAMKSGQISPGTAAARTGAEMLSSGAQIASWFVGAGEEETVGKTAATAAKTSIWSKALSFVKEALPFSVLQGIGAGAGDLSKGKDATTAATDTVTNTAGNVVGLLAFKGAGELLTRAGSALLQSPVVAAANKALVDTLSKTFGVDMENLTPSVVKELTNEVDAAHKQLISGVGDSIKTKTDSQTLWKSITDKMDPYIQKIFKEPATIFKDFYAKAPAIGGGFPETMDVVAQAKDHLDTVYGSASNLSGKVTKEQFQAAMSSGTEARAKAPLQQYMDEILSKIGQNGEKSVGAKDIESLALKRELFAGKTTSTEDSIMNQFTATLKKDMVGFLKSTPETAPLVDLYNQGQQKAQFNKDVLSGGIMSRVKTMATSLDDFFNNQIFSDKNPDPTEVKTLLDGLKLEGGQTQSQFSELAFNKIIDRAQQMSTDPAEGGKMIQSFLKNWTNTGLINPEHVNMLKSFSDLMTDKAGNYLDTVNSMMGKGNKFEAAATSLEQKTAQSTALQTFAKTLGKKPLYEVNANGSFDMTNLFEGLQKANGDKNEFGPLIEQFAKMNPQEVPVNKAKELIRTGLGATLLATGHTWWGAGMTMKGLSELTSGAGKVTASDVAEMASKLVGEIDEKTGKPYLQSNWITDLMSPKITVVKQAVKKIFMAGTGKIITPSE